MAVLPVQYNPNNREEKIMAYSVAMKRQMEKRLEEVFNECIDEMNAIDIPFGKITEVTVNYRAKSRWGQCCKRYDYTVGTVYKININADLCHPDASERGLKETIIHEILHTCPDCMCHTGEWKRLADLVNDCYGYNVKRTNNADEKGMNDFYKQHDELVRKPNWKYEIRCKSCGRVLGRRRKACKLTMNPYRYRCSYCYGNIEVIAS